MGGPWFCDSSAGLISPILIYHIAKASIASSATTPTRLRHLLSLKSNMLFTHVVLMTALVSAGSALAAPVSRLAPGQPGVGARAVDIVNTSSYLERRESFVPTV